MKTIDMGLNTEPAWLKADEIIERWKSQDNREMVTYWERAKAESIKLRDAIIQAIEEDGECALNWNCCGETRFNIHANQWAQALPQFRFEIGRYTCKAYSK